jgi:hypothetical protein
VNKLLFDEMIMILALYHRSLWHGIIPPFFFTFCLHNYS